MCGDLAGQVLACALEDGVLLCIVAAMMPLSMVSGCGSLWQPTEEIMVWPGTSVVGVVAWQDSPDGLLVVTHQYERLIS
jgi:hypothetical protein